MVCYGNQSGRSGPSRFVSKLVEDLVRR